MRDIWSVTSKGWTCLIDMNHSSRFREVCSVLCYLQQCLSIPVFSPGRPSSATSFWWSRGRRRYSSSTRSSLPALLVPPFFPRTWNRPSSRQPKKAKPKKMTTKPYLQSPTPPNTSSGTLLLLLNTFILLTSLEGFHTYFRNLNWKIGDIDQTCLSALVLQWCHLW